MGSLNKLFKQNKVDVSAVVVLFAELDINIVIEIIAQLEADLAAQICAKLDVTVRPLPPVSLLLGSTEKTSSVGSVVHNALS